MYYLEYRILPAPDHPREALLGEGLACCWIECDSVEEADETARTFITQESWLIVGREYGEVVTEEDCEDDDFRAYHEQALTDKEVFVIHQSPRHPVYWITAEVEEEGSGQTAEAHYFLCGESIMAD